MFSTCTVNNNAGCNWDYSGTEKKQAPQEESEFIDVSNKPYSYRQQKADHAKTKTNFYGTSNIFTFISSILIR